MPQTHDSDAAYLSCRFLLLLLHFGNDAGVKLQRKVCGKIAVCLWKLSMVHSSLPQLTGPPDYHLRQAMQKGPKAGPIRALALL